MSNNQLERAEGMASLHSLEDLWLNDNKVENAGWLRQDLTGQRNSLTCIYLSGNPLAASLGGGYREWLREPLPRLQQIDADMLR